MHEVILLCLGLVFSVSLLVVLAQKLQIAYPIFLVGAGLIVSLIPGIPSIRMDPDLVFLVVLPPVLFDAAQKMSLKSLWKWRRIISVMAIGFVLFTAVIVAFVAHWLIPGFTLTQGLLLGAIISPPDAAAATSVLQYAKLPKGVVAILEGESLLNDATSLTVFRFALAAILTHHLEWQEVFTGFAGVAVSGIGIGLVFGGIFYVINKWLPTTANLDVAISLVIPFLIYITAESLHSSGVLAVVSGGLCIAYQNHLLFSHSSRLKSGALWSSIVFIINAVIFFLIGLQLPTITKGLQDMSIPAALKIAMLILLVVVGSRLLSGLLSSVFTRFISRYITVAQANPGWRNPLLVSWIGMRGVVSLASALSIPLLLSSGAPFPHRDLILFITFVVIIGTLVGQGLTLPWMIRKIKPQGVPTDTSDDQQLLDMELQLIGAAVGELDSNYPEQVERNALLRHKLEFLQRKIELLKQANKGVEERRKAADLLEEFKEVMMKVTEKERQQLHTFRKRKGYDDDVIRSLENKLDLEEENLIGGLDG